MYASFEQLNRHVGRQHFGKHRKHIAAGMQTHAQSSKCRDACTQDACHTLQGLGSRCFPYSTSIISSAFVPVSVLPDPMTLMAPQLNNHHQDLLLAGAHASQQRAPACFTPHSFLLFSAHHRHYHHRRGMLLAMLSPHCRAGAGAWEHGRARTICPLNGCTLDGVTAWAPGSSSSSSSSRHTIRAST